MADSRYQPLYPPTGGQSPTFNPARLSMPIVPTVGSAPSQYSLYSGSVVLLPPSSHQHHGQHQLPHSTQPQQPPRPQHPPLAEHTQHSQHSQHPQHPQQPQQYELPQTRRQTNPVPSATYQVGKDAATRSSSVRQVGTANQSARIRRSSTIELNSPRPIIITTSGANRPHVPSSSHTAGRNGERSPTREVYRSPDEQHKQFFSQPASSIRSRNGHRQAYPTIVDNEELMRIRDRGDPRLLEPYRPGRSGGPIYPSNPPHKAGSGKEPLEAVPDEVYEYYRPADLARYDLENYGLQTQPTSRRRRESLDRGQYYRPSVVLGSGYDRSRPPPTTRALEEFGRNPTSGIYDSPSIRMPVPPVPPPVPLPPSADVTRRSASDGQPLNQNTRRERPKSMYHDDHSHRSQDNLYYPSRNEDRLHDERRDVDREYNRRYGGDMFQDERVSPGGFGIRTGDGYDLASAYRRPGKEYVDMPQEPRRASDEPIDPYGERERDRDDRARRETLRGLEEQDEDRRQPTPKDDERSFKHKSAADPGPKPEKGDRGPREDENRRRRSRSPEMDHRRKHSPEEDRRRKRYRESRSRGHSRSSSRSRSRVCSQSPNSQARSSSWDRERRHTGQDGIDVSDDGHEQRNRRGDEAKINGNGPSASQQQLAQQSEDEQESVDVNKGKREILSKVNDAEDQTENKAKADKPDEDRGVPEHEPRNASRSPEKQLAADSARTPSKEREEEESRGRELVPAPAEKEKQVRVVSPPREKVDAKPPLKGILKPPKESFPEDPNPIREGVAPHKDDKTKKDAPPGARWTKIRRDIVNPEALAAGKERFEVRDKFVIVLRVLNKEEIEQYAYATQLIREQRHRRERPGRSSEKSRNREDEDRDRRHYKPHRRELEDDDRRYKGSRERDWDRDGDKRRYHHDGEAEAYNDGSRATEYYSHGTSYHQR